METSIINTQLIISMKLRKASIIINIKRMWLNKEKLAKNTTIYQNLVIFSWLYILLIFFLKKKVENTLKSLSIFIFITMAHIAQNSNKKLQRSLQIMSSNNFFFLFFVKTYVIHLLGTYANTLCNWLILWQNALYL